MANPDESSEADAQRRCIYALSAKGLPLDRIAEILAPLCRRHRVRTWQKLPSAVLKEALRWKQFSPAANPKPAADAPTIYHLRPAPKTCVAGPY